MSDTVMTPPFPIGPSGGARRSGPARATGATPKKKTADKARRSSAGKAAAQAVAAHGGLHATMGGLIGLALQSEEDVLLLQRQGLPTGAFERLAAHLPAGGEQIIGSRSSLRRRQAKGVLSEAESEKALRVARVLARAVGVFGDEAQAAEWLARPAVYVRDQAAVSPLALCAHEAGAKILENRLLQTQYGVF